MVLRRASSQQSLSDLCCGGGPVAELSGIRSKKKISPKRRSEKTKLRKSNSIRVLCIRSAGDNKVTKKSVQKLAHALRETTTKVADCEEPVSNHREKLLLLNSVAALYGLGNVVSKFVDVAPGGAPVSLNSAVKYASAALVFLPLLVRKFKRDDYRGHTRAGVELGLWTFAHSLLARYSPSNTDLNATPLLYALTVFGIPLMQLYSGRSKKVTWLAISAALLGMGLLEEEGAGWKGILMPKFGNAWAVLEASFSILQVIRSDMLGWNRDPVQLSAIQLAVLSLLNLGLDLSHLGSLESLASEVRTVPWCTLTFSGLVCLGLTSLLEMRGLQGVEGSAIAISSLMVPVWGAYFSLLQQGRSPQAIALLSGMVLLVARLCSFAIDRLLFRRVFPEEKEDHSSTLSIDKAPHRVVGSHLPVVILSCQLKCPYYATQAQALLGDMDSNMNSSLLLIENLQQHQQHIQEISHADIDNGPGAWIHWTNDHGNLLIENTGSVVANLDATCFTWSINTLQMVENSLQAAAHTFLTILVK